MTSFEHSGFWWDPRERGTEWPGTLRFDAVNGAVLTRTIAADPRLFFADAKEFDVLHGKTTGGLPITLLSAFERNYSEIYANAVIVGFHAGSADPLITAAAGVIEQLEEWWHPRAVANDPALTHPDVGVQYRQPPDVDLHDDGLIRTTLRSAGLPSYAPRKVSIREEIRIEMKAATPQPLRIFRKRMHACQDLLSVAALTLCNVEELRLVPPYEDKRNAVVGRFYGVPIYDPATRGADFLFRSRDVEERLPAMFAAWLESAERLRVVRSLYFSGVYGKAFLELRLLAFAQAAEAYHRRVFEGQDLYMDAGAYERDVLPQLQAAIPKSLGSDHRQSLKKRMEFGNEVSFGRRLRTLFREHEAALAAAVPEPCSWIKMIVDYRNGFTHHPVVDEELEEQEKTELIQCNYVLQILLELCFLKSMALDAETIAALAKKCDRYRKVRERFFPDDEATESGAKAQGAASVG